MNMRNPKAGEELQIKMKSVCSICKTCCSNSKRVCFYFFYEICIKGDEEFQCDFLQKSDAKWGMVVSGRAAVIFDAVAEWKQMLLS